MEKGVRRECALTPAGVCCCYVAGHTVLHAHLVKYVVELVRGVEEHAIRVSCV
jgi:hypothetical protein